MIITRFAPSPTGNLHLGGARTALFNYLHAISTNGKFLIRIEDTDKLRSKKEYEVSILNSLYWLGISTNDKIVRQSEQIERHLEVANRLLNSGKAYKCYCTPERLNNLRNKQKGLKIQPKYDGKCRNLGVEKELSYVIRLKVPKSGNVSWNDTVQGNLTVRNEDLDDLIIVRSDGTPTYHLSVVVDDHDSGVNHIIRGDDHLSNTPKQIHIYNSLRWEIPKYSHIPLIHDKNGKMSKRDNSWDILSLRKQGYLPSAVVNYMVRLGWSYGDLEIFNLTDLKNKFNLGNVGKSPAIIDVKKYEWVNAQHLKSNDSNELLDEVSFHLNKMGYTNVDLDKISGLLDVSVKSSRNVVQICEMLKYLYIDTVIYDQKAVKKFINDSIIAILDEFSESLSGISWDIDSIKVCFNKIKEKHTLKMPQLAQPIRIALTGSTVSPGVFDTIFYLGKEKTINRLQSLIRSDRDGR